MVYPINKSNFNIKEFIYLSKNKIVIDLLKKLEKILNIFFDELNNEFL